MKPIKSAFSLLSPKDKSSVIDGLIAYFHRERGEEIGIIAAEDLLDFILDQVTGPIYNRGILDTQDELKKRLDDFDLDLSILLKKYHG